MKYCVISTLTFNTPAQNSGFFNSITAKLKGKQTWGELVNSSGQDMEGFPSHNLMIRFDNEVDADEVYAYIKDRMEKIPVLKGSVSKHYCYHDEGGLPCVIEEEYEK